MCGGTKDAHERAAAPSGLSPRVRGNLHGPLRIVDAARSIPACAGEPVSFACVTTKSKVYPRVCGGTSVIRLRDNKVEGLSPRVRGNRAATD